jgi:hypothetical protein
MEKTAMEKLAYELGSQLALEQLTKEAYWGKPLVQGAIDLGKNLWGATKNLGNTTQALGRWVNKGMTSGFDPKTLAMMKARGKDVAKGLAIPAAGAATMYGGYQAMKPEPTAWEKMQKQMPRF